MNGTPEQSTDKETWKRLRILQINLNKSPAAHAKLLNAELHAEWDLILLQEPHENYYKSMATARGFRQVYPAQKGREKGVVRSGIWVNEYISTCSWKEVVVEGTADVTAIQILTSGGRITIYNIYNSCEDNKSEKALRVHLEANERELTRQDHHMIWAGDFNRHHPLWDADTDERLFTREAPDRAQPLIDMIAEWDMEMLLPKGIPTLEHFVTKKWSRPDNIFGTEGLVERIVECDTQPGLLPPKTDHLQVGTILDLSKVLHTSDERRNWREVDWEKFEDTLESALEGKDPERPIRTKEEFDERVDDLMDIITETVEKEIRPIKPSTRSRRWWNKDLSAMRERKQKLSWSHTKLRELTEHPVHQEYRDQSNKLAEAITEAKRKHWERFLERANKKDLWTASGYIKNPNGDGGSPRMPSLKVEEYALGVLGGPKRTRTVDTNDKKAEVLAKSFFPKRPTGLPTPRESTSPGEQIQAALPIHPGRVWDHMRKLAPYKAPGLDGIPNILLKECAKVLAPHLATIFNAVFELGVYHQRWKDSTTCVLRKPGKPSYKVPKAYRPIALLSTVGKLLSAIVAEDMTRIIEQNELLPKNHYGERPGRTTTDAIQHLVNRIKKAWQKGRVVSVLYLDVEGAFPNAVTARVLGNMRKRRIPEPYVKMIENMLNGRRTKLRFDDFVSEFLPIDNGIGQGCPLSMVIYILYNADLLTVPTGDDKDAIGYVDDAIYIAEGYDFEETTAKLRDMMTRPGGGLEWSKTHNSKFEMSKVAIMHFLRRQKEGDDGISRKAYRYAPDLTLNGTIITQADEYKYLGVYIDPELNWKTQTARAIAKATKWVLMFRRLAKPRTGLSINLAQKLYKAVGIPKLTYATEIWYTPPAKEQGKRNNIGLVAALRQMKTIQRTATLAITGATRSTAGDILDLHAGIKPIKITLRTIHERSYIRLCTLPDHHALAPTVKQDHKDREKKLPHRTPIQTMVQRYPEHDPAKTEKIALRIRPPDHEPTFDTLIATTRKESIEQEKEDTARVKIYTDGLGIDEKTGAAALLYYGQDAEPTKTLHYHLGRKANHSTYEAEWIGAILAPWILLTKAKDQVGHEDISVYTDNQSIIEAMRSGRPGPAQYMQDKFY